MSSIWTLQMPVNINNIKLQYIHFYIFHEMLLLCLNDADTEEAWLWRGIFKPSRHQNALKCLKKFWVVDLHIFENLSHLGDSVRSYPIKWQNNSLTVYFFGRVKYFAILVQLMRKSLVSVAV